ncbi:MAG: large conductance mechanosensitive channel protein MscL [Thermoanaerobaculum sp.]|nr:large conductance mechanosensitive channel protein MscL [Thermoanaerobaculum sp.]
MFKGFKNFVLRGNVVELGVAVIMGGAFGQVVNSFVGDVLTPALGALGGAPDFSSLALGPIALGRFVNAVVNLLIVATAIYFLVVVPMERIQERLKTANEAPTPPAPPSEEVLLLRQILEELQRKP